MKPILAVMQNMWLRDPARYHASLARREAEHGKAEAEVLRRHYIASFLFMGCMTGRRLKQTFGEDLVGQILWEESTRAVADNPRQTFKPDHEHLRAIIEAEQPRVIITFGGIAYLAVAMVMSEHGIRKALIRCPHPAARQATVMDDLRKAAAALNELLSKP